MNLRLLLERPEVRYCNLFDVHGDGVCESRRRDFCACKKAARRNNDNLSACLKIRAGALFPSVSMLSAFRKLLSLATVGSGRIC